MANQRIIKNYPSQATGILQDENMKWLAISSQIPKNSIMKDNYLPTVSGSATNLFNSLILDKKDGKLQFCNYPKQPNTQTTTTEQVLNLQN